MVERFLRNTNDTLAEGNRELSIDPFEGDRGAVDIEPPPRLPAPSNQRPPFATEDAWIGGHALGVGNNCGMEP